MIIKTNIKISEIVVTLVNISVPLIDFLLIDCAFPASPTTNPATEKPSMINANRSIFLYFESLCFQVFG